jgi:hypothetical protein
MRLLWLSTDDGRHPPLLVLATGSVGLLLLRRVGVMEPDTAALDVSLSLRYMPKEWHWKCLIEAGEFCAVIEDRALDKVFAQVVQALDESLGYK